MSPTSTSLTLQALLKSAVHRGGMSVAARAVSGLSPAAKALYAAAAASRESAARPGAAADQLVVVVVATDADVEQMTGDVRFFLGALEGASEAAVEQSVLGVPSHQVDPYRAIAPHFRVASARARALHALATGTARVIVASAAALLPRVSAPERLLAASVELKPDLDIAPTDLADLLSDAGFTREDPVDAHGEFCVRGGVVDVFPAGEPQPVRLEFVGDTIESIRRYDPASQRSVESLERVVIAPLREVFEGRATPPRSGGALAPPTAKRAGLKPGPHDENVPGPHDENVPGPHDENVPGPYDEERGQTLEPSADDRSATLFDYLTRGGRPLLFVSEPDEVRAEIDKTLEQIHASYASFSSRDSGLGAPGLKAWPTGGGTRDSAASRLSAVAGDDVTSEWFEAWQEENEDEEADAGERKGRRRGPRPSAGASRHDTFAVLVPPPAAREPAVPPPEALLVSRDEIDARLAAGARLEQLGIDEPAEPARAGLKPGPYDGKRGVGRDDGKERGPDDEEEGGPGEPGDAAESTDSTESTPSVGQGFSPADAHRAQRTLVPSSEADSPDPCPPIPDPSAFHIPCQPSVELHGRIADWVAEIRRGRERGDTIVLVAATPGRADRTVEILAEYDLLAVPIVSARAADSVAHAAVLVATGSLSRGFRLPAAGLQLYAETDIFEEERRAPERRRSLAGTFLSDLRDLKVGDLVVHVDHGIGVFVGLRQLALTPADGTTQEFMELRYAGDDKLYVPVERLDLIQKYTGASRPPLDRLGGTTWERAKTRVKKAMRDMAEELLRLYAARKAIPGHAFTADTHWQQEFEEAFEYEPTPDQWTAIEDIKRDMETPSPMDRLLCGDVGYGKTEVAMRAAFKAVMDGKQVAFLAPTTVLAFQHLKTLTERFAAFPVRIDMISRFRSRAEQKQILADLAAGKVEVIVGTHRLLSKDVQFRDLGLLVVDEEQRFGVAHKERLKQLRKKVDVLTMSATPIPRTLNMSLVGIRDMSIIETPPKDRLSIQTNVVRFDQQVIARAIRNELARGGQIYFVHNRVESIFSIAHLVERLVPEARIAVAHGQMSEDALERAMVDFVAHKYDILLATTIIENGLDIPNVNTIVINRADRYGLSQLYQLRGRVGRSDRPAYAYLLIPPEDSLAPLAKKRLAAIKEFSDLGSGFRVAALDLEIRGAGNLLGGEQSGHIEAIGFEMYMKLLDQTVRELKGEEIEEEVRATVNLGVDLRIDEQYVPDMNQRLMIYRKVASARRDEEIEGVLEEMRDRYGPLPPSVLNLADYGRIRVMADRLGIESIDHQGHVVVLKFRENGASGAGGRGPGARSASAPLAPSAERREPTAPLAPSAYRLAPSPATLVRLLRERHDITLAPPASLKLDLQGPHHRRSGGPSVPSTTQRRTHPYNRRSGGALAPPARAGLKPGPYDEKREPGPYDEQEHQAPSPETPDPRSSVGRGFSPANRRSPETPDPRSSVGRGFSPANRRSPETPAPRPESWWTARATAGEVKPGFSKEEILRPAREDPRGPSGVLTKVAVLLAELAE